MAVFGSGFLPAALSAAATVDFGVPADPPLVKKFSQYNAGLPPQSHYDRDLDHIVSLRSDHLRIDLGMGKDNHPETTGRNAVSGTAASPVYDFRRLDRIAAMLLERDVLPYYAWCYVPYPLQRRPGDFRSMRDDDAAFEAYRRFHREFGARYAARPQGRPASGTGAAPRVGYHEIYNEPDLQSEFLTEPFSHYLRMYQAGAAGIREGDPDAVVGGPALAMGELFGHARQFTDYVAANDLPLDFFSFHHYWADEDYAHELGTLRSALAAHPRFRSVPIHVNELNWSGGRIGEGSLNNRHGIASRMFDVFAAMLRSHDVPQASWAQFMESTAGDDAYGIIHRDGRRKAAYNAFRIWADLPEDRAAVEGADSAVGMLASASARRACLAAWNRTDGERTVAFAFRGLPAGTKRLRVFRVDARNASSGDGAYEELRAVETRAVGEGGGGSWSGALPARGLLYLVFDDGVEAAFRDDREKYPPAARPGRFLRSHHWYPERGAESYAYFDRKSWTARLGMGGAASGQALTAARADSLPEDLLLDLATTGNPRRVSPEAALALRVDFAGTAGTAARSALVHWGLPPEAAASILPWGTGRPADTVLVAGEAEGFPLRLSRLAPPGWGGQATFSFLMRATGAGSRAAIRLRRPGSAAGIPREAVAARGAHAWAGTVRADRDGLRLTGLPTGQAAMLELHDLGGRRVRRWSRFADGLAPWAGEPPPAGLYRLRLRLPGGGGIRLVRLGD